MSPRQTHLPTIDEVRSAINAVSDATGRPATAFAVARRLGIANTTFRRNFPDIVADLQQPQREARPAADTQPTRFDQLKKENDRLRSELRDWKSNCELAIANIQRLTLENHDLRKEIEALTNTTSIDRRRPSRPPSN
ncbi:hypothetical protein ACRCUN_32925 [Mycobacterium sp. LTG2003]